MNAHNCTRAAAAIAAFALFATAIASAAPKEERYAPVIDPARFAARVDHPYFPLVPGTKLVYREAGHEKTSENELTVLTDTRVILGVTCTIVHDVVRENGKVKEDTYDWYAQDVDGNVWYFGEDTKEFLPRGRVSTEGSWEAGKKGGRAGIIMPAKIAPGAPYRQEYAPGEAEDMGQIVGVGEKVVVPFGTYDDCVRTKDWSLLETGHEFKWYARGIGFVRAESASHEVEELVSVTKP